MISKAQIEKLCRGISLDADIADTSKIDFRCCHCWYKRCFLAEQETKKEAWLENKNFNIPEKCPYFLEHVLMESNPC